ncbi:hypothetical protein NJC10_00205 [Micrococcus sp. M4NT]|uniref:hypothetical protein n=1 Tax=Micrococcus sp. M4NT TaxID=2957501 RepID=UPI0029ABFC82|nr:hypothetical protein [Micrococcus sp. M4NT]MDX2340103.1 hypothetical protein [Micrococcus sp. M4NT]
MTQLSTALHLALTDLVGRERLEDETGAQTAEYGEDVSQHPVNGCGHERAPPVLETPRGLGHHG